MDLGLEEAVALVGGASAGMGLAIAEALRGEGANVVMFARGRERLLKEADRIGGIGVEADARSSEDVARVVDVVIRRFGRLDVLVLNAGGPPAGQARDLADEAIKDAVDLLLLSKVRLTRLCLPYLVKSGQGRIIAIESTSVLEPIESLTLSNSLRPAVVGWLKDLSREVGADGVTVNMIAPGRISTETFDAFYTIRSKEDDLKSIPLSRFGTPKELADVVCFLASARASYVSGVLVPVDGGQTRRVW